MLSLQDFVSLVVKAANAHQGVNFDGPLADALQKMAHLADADRAAAPKALGQALAQIDDPVGLGCVAIWLGTCVEKGVSAEDSAQEVLSALLKLTARIETCGDEHDDAEPDARVAAGIQFAGQAAVAHLGRAPLARAEVQRTGEAQAEMQRVAHLALGAMWVEELLLQRSGELLVLHGVQSVGVRIRFENIARNFHLFSLLQGELHRVMPGAQTPDPNVIEAARKPGAALNDSGWWHYGQPTSPEAKLATSVWGEGSPDDIVEIDGTRVMLLWPPLVESRRWDSGFFGPYLQASPPNFSVLNVLDAAEVKRWRSRLELGAS